MTTERSIDPITFEVLRNACTEDIVFMDPQLGRLHGLAAVADMIGGYMSPAMEGHEDEAREAMKDSGIGTPATRAAPIASLGKGG